MNQKRMRNTHKHCRVETTIQNLQGFNLPYLLITVCIMYVSNMYLYKLNLISQFS